MKVTFNQDTRGNHSISAERGERIMGHVELNLLEIAKNPVEAKNFINGIANMLATLACYMPKA